MLSFSVGVVHFAIIASEEVEIVGRGRFGDGKQGILARVRDWCWWNAGTLAGVPWARNSVEIRHVGLIAIRIDLVGTISNNCIGTKHNAALQTKQEYLGDLLLVFIARGWGFALDD